jgi:PAS domain S-box-containing protein
VTEKHIEPDYSLLFEQTPSLYLVLDTNLRVIAASDAYLQATLTRREDIIGRHVFEVFPDNPGDPSADAAVPKARASFNRVIHTLKPDIQGLQRHDVRKPESEGGGFEVRYWNAVNSPILGPDGSLAYILHRVENVTEFVLLKQQGIEQADLADTLRDRALQMEADLYARSREAAETSRKLKEANEELAQLYEKTRRESEQRYRKLFYSSPDAMILASFDEGRYLEVNDAFCRLIGYSREEIVGNTALGLGVWVDLEERARIRILLQENGKVSEFPCRLMASSGEIKDIYLSVETIEVDGRLCMLSVVQDVTERKAAEKELLQQRLLLSEAEKLSHTGAWEWDLATDRWTFSDEWLAIHGCSDGTPTPDELLNLAHPEDRAEIARALEEVRKGIAHYDIEHRIARMDDGNIRLIHGYGRYQRDATGEVVKVYGFAQDITERKGIEEKLRRSEQHLRDILDNTVGLVGLMTPDGTLIEANRTALMIADLKRDDVLNRPFEESYWWSWSPEVQQRLRKAVSQSARGKRVRYDEVIRTGENRFANIDFMIAPIYSSEGRVAYLVPSALDITKRKRLEGAVRQSEEKFRTLADNMSQFAWMADDQGWIFWYNKRWYDYTGTTLEEMKGWGWKKVHHPDHIDRVVEKISRCFRSGEMWEDTFPLRGKDGRYRWFLSRAIPTFVNDFRSEPWASGFLEFKDRLRTSSFDGLKAHEKRPATISLPGRHSRK